MPVPASGWLCWSRKQHPAFAWTASVSRAVARLTGRNPVSVPRGATEEEALRALLLARPYAPSTTRKYMHCTWRFLSFTGCVRVAQLRQADVIAYLRVLRRRGLSDASLRLHLCALRAVFDRLLGLGITRGIRHAPRPPRRAPGTAAQVIAMLWQCRRERSRRLLFELNVGEYRVGQLRAHWLPAPTALGGGDWAYPSPVCDGPLSDRALRAVIEALAASCGFSSNTTAVRKAPALPEHIWDAAGLRCGRSLGLRRGPCSPKV